MGSSSKKTQRTMQNAQAESAQAQARQIKALEPYETELGKLQLQSDTAVQQLPIWATGRERAVPLYNQLPTSYQNIDMSNPEVQKWQNMFDTETQQWAGEQMKQANQADAAGKTFGSSYSAMRDATLQNEIAKQKSQNAINAINTVGSNYATNMNNLQGLIGTYLGDGQQASYTPVQYIGGSSGGYNTGLNQLLAQLGQQMQ